CSDHVVARFLDWCAVCGDNHFLVYLVVCSQGHYACLDRLTCLGVWFFGSFSSRSCWKLFWKRLLDRFCNRLWLRGVMCGAVVLLICFDLRNHTVGGSLVTAAGCHRDVPFFLQFGTGAFECAAFDAGSKFDEA